MFNVILEKVPVMVQFHVVGVYEQIKYVSEVRGKSGNEIWEYILESSTRSRPSVDAAAGLVR